MPIASAAAACADLNARLPLPLDPDQTRQYANWSHVNLMSSQIRQVRFYDMNTCYNKDSDEDSTNKQRRSPASLQDGLLLKNFIDTQN